MTYILIIFYFALFLIAMVIVIYNLVYIKRVDKAEKEFNITLPRIVSNLLAANAIFSVLTLILVVFGLVVFFLVNELKL